MKKTNNKIKVLVVDDSGISRKKIISVLNSDDEISVVGEAENGKKAVEMAKNLKPDIVTMDIEMPVMNGPEAIEIIMKSNAVPIVVITGYGDAYNAYTAISKGALEVISKSDIHANSSGNFINKIKYLSKAEVKNKFVRKTKKEIRK